MAKQRETGRQAGRRGSATGGNGGRTALGLTVMAAVAGGGFLLYRHTTPYQGAGRARPEVVEQRPAPPTNGSALSGPIETTLSPAAPAGAGLPGPSIGLKKPPLPPFGEGEEVFETGAKVYVAHCASCHGQPGRLAPAADGAVQLWDPHTAAVQRIAAQPAGVTFAQIADGVAAAHGAPAMAGYRHLLSETQMWDVALLLRNAGQELPDPVVRLLRGSH